MKFRDLTYFIKISFMFTMLQTIYPLSTETIITHRDKKAIINSSSFTHSPKSTLLLNKWHMEKLFSHWWLEIDPDLQPLEKNVKTISKSNFASCKKTLTKTKEIVENGEAYLKIYVNGSCLIFLQSSDI